MEILKTIKCHPTKFINYNLINEVVNLVYFDGPLLKLYRNESQYVLYYWVDKDEKFNRWVIFTPNEEELNRYLRNGITLRQLMLNFFGIVYVVDVDGIDDKYGILIGALPDSYMPTEDSWFQKDLTLKD